MTVAIVSGTMCWRMVTWLRFLFSGDTRSLGSRVERAKLEGMRRVYHRCDGLVSAISTVGDPRVTGGASVCWSGETLSSSPAEVLLQPARDSQSRSRASP